MNLHLAQLLFVVHTHLGFKSQADSESPLKWTVIGFCNYIEKILAIAQLIRVDIYQLQSILISVRFNALKLLARNLFPGGKTTQNRRFECEEFVVRTHLGLKSQADSESPLKWTVTGLSNYIEKILAIAQLIRVDTYQFQFILISVRFNALKLLARNLFLGGRTTQNRRFECEEFVVRTHLGLKSQADSESPLKWTVIGLSNFLEKILAIAQLIRVHIYQFQSILISVRFNALQLLARNLFLGGKTTQNRRFEFVVHTHLGMQGIQ